MLIEKYVCDFCRSMNIEQKEFANEVILTANDSTDRNWHVCPECLQKVINYITSNLIK